MRFSSSAVGVRLRRCTFVSIAMSRPPWCCFRGASLSWGAAPGGGLRADAAGIPAGPRVLAVSGQYCEIGPLIAHWFIAMCRRTRLVVGPGAHPVTGHQALARRATDDLKRGALLMRLRRQMGLQVRDGCHRRIADR